MSRERFTNWLISFLMILLVVITSCRKDPALKNVNPKILNLSADSVSVNTILSLSGNYLAASGTLTVKIEDSTYIFDARRDSIAFVNVHIAGNKQYYGITAINKEHTMSFGISAAGFAYSNIIGSVAGSQLLLNQDVNKPGLQYSLSKLSTSKDFGNINIIRYNRGNELAKGAFFTFLAKDDKAGSPFYKVEGSFDLKLK